MNKKSAAIIRIITGVGLSIYIGFFHEQWNNLISVLVSSFFFLSILIGLNFFEEFSKKYGLNNLLFGFFSVIIWGVIVFGFRSLI